MKQPQWKQRHERSSGAWMRIIVWLARRSNRRFIIVLLYPITLYFYLFDPESRHNSRAFLSRVLSRPVRRRDVFRHILTFSITLLDRVYLFTGRLDEYEVEVEGAGEILEYLAQGQGCLLLGSHLGSFEIMRAIGVWKQPVDFELRVLMHIRESEQLAPMLAALAPEMEKIIIPTEQPDTMLRVKEALDQGALVALLGDRVCGSESRQRFEFLGAEAEFPLAPAQLALALRVPVFGFYGIYRGGNRYQVRFHKITAVGEVSRQQRQQWLCETTGKYVDELARMARLAPYNWFNFHDFWASARESE